MAASMTKDSDDQKNKTTSSAGTFDESKEVLPASSSNVEEIIEETSVRIVKQRFTERQNELSPHLIQKLSSTPLTAPCIAASSSRGIRAVDEHHFVVQARPFDEFLVDQSNTNTSSGTTTKPVANSSSSTGKSS